MTRVNPLSGNRMDNQRIGTKALSQCLDRGGKDEGCLSGRSPG
jgi:hypothetical protein